MARRRDLFFKYLRFFYLTLCIITLTLGTSGLVFAQEESSSEFTLEEIVVTAEKREAQLQKVPMDIAVVQPDTMRIYNINQMHDLMKMIPDLSVSNTVGTFNLVSIREVQMLNFNPIYESTVATHLDGVQLSSFLGLDNFFFDLERIEVLKGPQGTLYGRGSTAGSMNIITRKPILGEFSGNASLEAGNYGRYRMDWAINLPMGDKMSMRIAGRRNLSGGFSDSGFGDANSWSHRASWRWEPNDRVTVNLSADFMQQDDEGQPMGGFAASGYYLDTYGGIQIVANDVETANNALYSYDARFQSGGPVRSRGEAKWAMGNTYESNYVDAQHYGFSAILDYDLDFATATIQYGHRALAERKNFWWASGAYLYPYPYMISQTPYGPFAMVTAAQPYTQVTVRIGTPMQFDFTEDSGQTNTVEARLTSNTTIAGGDKLEWIVGGMGQRDATTEVVWGGLFGAPIQGANGFHVQVKTKTEGLFTQASWMPIEKWNFTGGLRENRDAKDLYGDYNQTGNFYTRNYEWSELTYRANISYFPTDNIMPYLTYSRGYKTGNISYEGNEILPELLNAWELGLKSRFLDNKLQVNAGYYYYDYKNYSDWAFVNSCYVANADHTCVDVGGNPEQGGTAYDPDNPGVYFPDGNVDLNDYDWSNYAAVSPGGAEQQGISVSIDYLPTMNDRLSVSASWRNNKYASPYNKLRAILALFPDADSAYRDYEDYDMAGYEFGGAPIRGNLSYTHTFRFGSGDMLMASGTAFYEGKGIDKYLNVGDAIREYTMPGRDAYWTGDLSFMYTSSRWMSPGNMWSLRFSAQNIFDSDALSDISYSDDQAGFGPTDVYAVGTGTISGTYINPRTYGITFDINF
jgi:outer membrane receptor protein involved in Fe transport